MGNLNSGILLEGDRDCRKGPPMAGVFGKVDGPGDRGCRSDICVDLNIGELTCRGDADGGPEIPRPARGIMCKL